MEGASKMRGKLRESDPKPGRALPTTTGRVAFIYNPGLLDVAAAMDRIRFLRLSEAFARRGHQVDRIVNVKRPKIVAPGLREVPPTVDWSSYDVIKTVFHEGFAQLREAGGADHPFIVSKLGSVVGSGPRPGVYFFGDIRKRLFETQLDIAAHSRYVNILTEPSRALWHAEHGPTPPTLIIPTGVDAGLPRLRRDPYRAMGIDQPVVLFAGNIYDDEQQPEVNLEWQDRLNRVGRALAKRRLTLVAMGYGNTDQIDPAAVRHVGRIDQIPYWSWQRHARVGLVLAHGPVQDNESSKIYHYLRTALPTVCEAPVPNARMITDAQCGELVPLGDPEAMADAAERLVRNPPNLPDLPAQIARDHSWEARAAAYDPIIAEAVTERAERAA